MYPESFKNRQFLRKQWSAVYQSKEVREQMVANVDDYTFRQVGEHYLILNKSLGSKKEPKAIDRRVFSPFDITKTNFCDIQDKYILFHLDLAEKTIITKAEMNRMREGVEAKQKCIKIPIFPVMINTTPTFPFHVIIYTEEQLPQIVDAKIMFLHLNLFQIFPGIKVAYNSVGVGSVNHLHFHLIYSEQTINSNKFPLQTFQQNLWLRTTLVKPSEQTSSCSVGVIINEIDEKGNFAFVLKPQKKQNEEPQFSEIANSLSFVFGIISKELVELNIAHTFLLSDEGESIYICVRDFSTLTNRFGWLEMMGVIPVHSEAAYQMKEEEIIAKKKQLALDSKSMELLKSNIKKHLQKFI